MLERLIELDQRFFVFLNGLGSSTFDPFWLYITKQTNWSPLFIVLLVVIYRKIGWKQTLYLMLSIAVLVLCTDQVTNIVKAEFQRLRPCSTPSLIPLIRIVKSSDTFSFFSGHAANSMAVALFVYLRFKNKFRFFYLLFLWPLFFAYSRIYLGLHFPLDILSGFIFGAIMGTLGFLIFNKYMKSLN